MPKEKGEECEKNNESLTWYLLPSNENFSSFAQTNENLPAKKGNKSSFAENNSKIRNFLYLILDSNKVSFAKKVEEIEPIKISEEDDSWVLHDSGLVHLKSIFILIYL